MDEASVGEITQNQIERIDTFKQKLEDQRGESVSLEQAAREWVRRYAESVRGRPEGNSGE